MIGKGGTQNVQDALMTAKGRTQNVQGAPTDDCKR